MNLPNFLSFSRIFLLFPIIISFEYNFYLFSVTTFIIAAMTDYLDGLIARKNNLTTKSGALLDLLADKIFVSTLLIWLTYKLDSQLILISSILIITREISISYLRMFMISNSRKVDDLKSDFLGKFKTTLQMTGIGFTLIIPISIDYISNISISLIALSAIISWYSFIKYLNKWFKTN
ncbi:MAG: CDP-diacylglycerol--glycerol-3-phosphate 3-phosphatidyltransferase [Flavobacteriales bacterium]